VGRFSSVNAQTFLSLYEWNIIDEPIG